MAEKVTLRPNQRRAIEVLTTDGTVTAAAEAAGVSRKTIYKWLKEPPFQGALHQAEEVAMSQLSAQLARLSEKSVQVIEDKLDAGNLRAADANLRHLLRIVELLAKLRGELDERPTVNLLMAPQWVEVRAALMDALDPFPEARAAAAGALVKLDGGDGRGP